ncbi:heavy metal-associated isoprenylated plant protein 29-like [Corylus avellana]|uniref:heavy metal-associated isoprenylated plant protein 29-like n=1 Tax=Corylus avellana TaxID=13451 RepID=UPI00286AB187|nr:heavy metal-associated isoprenylated plant protein 29-like [Corylus avellana]
MSKKNLSYMIVEMIVPMDCAGCERKIKKALHKLDGVGEVEVDLAMQKVTVTGWINQEKVLKTVRRTGRRAELWPYPYNPEYQNFTGYNNYYHHQSQPTTTYYASESISSYNDYVHGYNGQEYSHYPQIPYPNVYDSQATAIFSEENPHACSIM